MCTLSTVGLEAHSHNFICVLKFRAYLHGLVAGKLNSEFTAQ